MVLSAELWTDVLIFIVLCMSKNFRGISLLNYVYKIRASVTKNNKKYYTDKTVGKIHSTEKLVVMDIIV
jgi:hypothetical protein